MFWPPYYHTPNPMSTPKIKKPRNTKQFGITGHEKPNTQENLPLHSLRRRMRNNRSRNLLLVRFRYRKYLIYLRLNRSRQLTRQYRIQLTLNIRQQRYNRIVHRTPILNTLQ